MDAWMLGIDVVYAWEMLRVIVFGNGSDETYLKHYSFHIYSA